jgi:hypothetical protein
MAVPLAKPATRRHPGEGHGLAFRSVTAHLQQAIHHPKPVGHRATHTADVFTDVGIGNFQVIDGAATFHRR